MNDQHDLTDEQCDRLASVTLDRLAKKHSLEHGAIDPADLNPNINTHHALRRSLVRVAYELGKMAGVSQTNTHKETPPA